MKTAIIYISRRGTTVEIAHMIRATLSNRDVELINLEQHAEPDLDMYPEVIIGGPIYMGDLPQKLRNYCKVHAEQLITKRLGLFVCGMIPDRARQQEELIRAYPKSLHEKAKVAAFLGGAFVMEKLNLLEKLMVRFIAKTKKSVQKIEQSEIDTFCRDFTSR